MNGRGAERRGRGIRVVLAVMATVCLPALLRGQCNARNFGCKEWIGDGLRGRIYYLPPNTSRLPDLSTLPSHGQIFSKELNVPTQDFRAGFPGVTDRFEWFAIEYTGIIRINHPGRYSFRLVSDDGSKLFIDDKLVIDNDGTHSTASKSGSADLEAGQHAIRVQYFQGPRFQVALQFFCTPESGTERLFPNCDLAVATDVTRGGTPVAVDRTPPKPEPPPPPPPPPPGRQETQLPGQGRVGLPMTLKVKVTGSGTPPDRMIAVVDGETVTLNLDRSLGPGMYSGTWTPKTAGKKKIHVTSEGGTPVAPIDDEVTVIDQPPPPPPPPPLPTMAQPGELSLGQGIPANLGRLHSGETKPAEARLTGGKIVRDVDIEISTDFQKHNATLQIQTPDGWQTLSSTPIRTRLIASDPFHWPLRLRLGKCPEACQPGEMHHVTFAAHITDGSIQRADVPLQLEILPEPWYICWMAELLAALGVVVAGFIAYGIISPYRFGRRAGVQISPAEDLSEGYFFPLRAARGSRAGFYRDARLFLTEDFRLQGKKTGGFVRLRADREMVRIRPENGRSLYRQQADGTWELLSAHQESIARPGALYRNDARTVFFDIRTK